ncbi:LysR family transcriptional regulator [Roseobacter sinensis]|uniref:LysR family transcriptional regulator n=1 Tax=Roseobacter sinensis TaxID=2931391 RepID=A0ABT3BCK5_9RHOB|nr:LysR family transcriptional regulator [Roseobacter sp. WL0113]MCV3271309.1 LysR family transcriptional regulator [Roseobacter sp. WL0113]
MKDLNALESFVVAAETLNFSAAADRRNTVQSAVSAHIRKLEEELGCALFNRGRGRAMSLTAEGEAFVVYARRILGLSDEAIRAVRAARTPRRVRLGTTVTLAMSAVTKALQSFAALEPDVQIHIQCERSDALLALLDAGEIDMAFMMDQGRRPGREFVEATALVWVGTDEVPGTTTGDVPLVFLTDGRDLRGYAFEALDRTGRVGYLAHLSPHPIGVRAFVLAGLAVTVMPATAVTPPLVDLGHRLELPPLKDVALSLYCDPKTASSEVKTLAAVLKEQLVEPQPVA